MGKALFSNTNSPLRSYFSFVSTCLLFSLMLLITRLDAQAIGFISHHTSNKLPASWQNKAWHASNHAHITKGHFSKTKFLSNKNKHCARHIALSQRINKPTVTANSNINKTGTSLQSLHCSFANERVNAWALLTKKVLVLCI